jgi:broad specificity phosphatase PhoE
MALNPMLSRSFYFLRHGETDWNKQELLQGHSDIPLNDTGRAQAMAAAESFIPHNIQVIVASPLSRARETAEIINKTLKAEMVFEHGIKERSFGDLEGGAYATFEAFKKKALVENLPIEENGMPCPPNAEPYAAFRARTLHGFESQLKAIADKNILFVSHGGVYRALCRSLNTDLRVSGNCEPFLFERGPQNWRIHDLKAKAA